MWLTECTTASETVVLKFGIKAKHKIEKYIYHKCSYLRKLSCYRHVRKQAGTSQAITKAVGTFKTLGNLCPWFGMSLIIISKFAIFFSLTQALISF